MTRILRRIISAGTLSLSLLSLIITHAQDYPNQAIGPCFWVNGSVSYANGNPSLRILRLDTRPRRILGVPPGWAVPPELANLEPFRMHAEGDFLVCPLTVSKPGIMQMVYIRSATHLLIVEDDCDEMQGDGQRQE